MKKVEKCEKGDCPQFHIFFAGLGRVCYICGMFNLIPIVLCQEKQGIIVSLGFTM